MSATRLVFQSEIDYWRARDINIDMLEAEGWKPQEDLEMIIDNERVERLTKALDDSGIDYEAAPL